jgi:CRISPR/Cas system CSM-associated protein Csm2 small subunit
MILGNAHRLEETVLQKAAKAKRAIDMGQSTKEVAQLFGVTAQTIANWTAAMALPEAIRKSLDDGKITLTLALELAKKPEEEQTAALKSAETVPLKGAAGKARVRKAPQEEVAKPLGKAQIRKFHTMLKGQERPDSNVELAIAMCEFILGDGTYRKLHAFSPLGEIAKEMIDA